MRLIASCHVRKKLPPVTMSLFNGYEIDIKWLKALFRYWRIMTWTKIQNKILKNDNQGKKINSVLGSWLFCLSLKYKYCISHIFTFDFRKVCKCYLLIKKRKCFLWKKVFPENLLTRWVFFNYPMSFLFTQVQDNIQEFDYSGNKIPDFFVQGHFNYYCLLYHFAY